MRILVFGKTGQVATELGLQADVIALDRSAADLADPTACARAIDEISADVVINAAAYTAVDRAEDEEELATVVNGAAPMIMAVAAARRDIPFLHVSTDYIFAGDGNRAWKPDDVTEPLGAYGRSKLAGEVGVRGAGGQHAILRTSWVFSAHGSNFVKTMLRLGAERDELSVVADQIGGPTSAADIAGALLNMAGTMIKEKSKSGTYHFAGKPDVSWADFADEIFKQAGLSTKVNPIPASQYPTPAKRPKNSRLDCSSLKRDFGIDAPDWSAGLGRVLADLNKSN